MNYVIDWLEAYATTIDRDKELIYLSWFDDGIEHLSEGKTLIDAVNSAIAEQTARL